MQQNRIIVPSSNKDLECATINVTLESFKIGLMRLFLFNIMAKLMKNWNQTLLRFKSLLLFLTQIISDRSPF